MEFDWWNGGFLTLAGGAIAWAVAQARIAKNDRVEREQSREASELALTQHQDGLTFELLKAAHSQAAAMRSELERVTAELAQFGALRWRVEYFEEAITHVEALIAARLDGRSEAAEDSARKFLARVQTMNTAAGLAANRAQNELARRKKIEKE